ncbi:MAG TPA: hypothetical protein VFG13_05180 [Blastococcus sp.]|nr:hypothetical protein [Blastococcus sp.]
MTTTFLPSITRTPDADVLRVLVDEALIAAATDDAADRYSSSRPDGRALLALAALARRAAGALGAEPGVALTSGPGIVVQRELAAAARLLDEAADSAVGEPEEIGDLLAPAQRLFTQLRG